MSGLQDDFESYKKVDKADVYKNELLAAKLVRTKEGVYFQYEKEYLVGENPAVATSLPKIEEPQYTKSGGIPAFFAGLLPEGRRLSVLQKKIKTSVDDDLSILLAIGSDLIGNVRVFPEGEEPQTAKPLIEVKKSFDEIDFLELLANFGDEDRVGMPGVQEKVSARRISLPASRAGDRYILKLQTTDFPHVVENEYYFVQKAKQIKINTVDAEIVKDINGNTALLIKRFDRITDSNGNIISLAVEDACQVMGYWPGDKYNLESEEVVQALSAKCASRKLAQLELFKQFCFAWLTGNGDMHAKNLSIVQSPNGEWRISPAYDLPSTLPYGDSSMALRMSKRGRDLSRKILLDFGTKIGLSERISTNAIDDVLEGTKDIADDIKAGALPFNDQIRKDFSDALRYRRVVSNAAPTP